MPLFALPAVVLLPAPSEAAPAPAVVLDLGPLFRNRALRAYVLAFAGNIWEVSAIRAWFVAYLTWALALPHDGLPVPRPADISGLASLAGFAVSLLVAEFALRRGPQAIVAACIGSVLVLLALAATAGGPGIVILPLPVLAQIASLADAAALASGAVAACDNIEERLQSKERGEIEFLLGKVGAHEWPIRAIRCRRSAARSPRASRSCAAAPTISVPGLRCSAPAVRSAVRARRRAVLRPRRCRPISKRSARWNCACGSPAMPPMPTSLPSSSMSTRQTRITRTASR